MIIINYFVAKITFLVITIFMNFNTITFRIEKCWKITKSHPIRWLIKKLQQILFLFWPGCSYVQDGLGLVFLIF